MRVLEYVGLDTSRLQKPYAKVTAAIAAGNFRAAQVRKLATVGPHKLYRARLDDSNRLLFALLHHQGENCALMLEVIRNHDYAASIFLRGVAIDESRIPDVVVEEALSEAEPVRYLHPEHTKVHWLDKPISFDDRQAEIFRLPAPLIVVGSAGSGKTALTLEKLKQMEGEVLYVTHSAFLARNARDLYYGSGFERAGQDAVFLSYRELLESIRMPQGREAMWRDFAAWFDRQRQVFGKLDPHQVFEEIRGVITADAQGPLSRAAYQDLGVRQSIFNDDERETVYDLFEKYRAWLSAAGLFDLNLVAYDWLAHVTAQYDFVVIDEVQDMTPVQLAVVLRALRQPGQFLLCGDSNQIVHPNFFSWAKIKTLFWQDPELAERQSLRVLASNFRNGRQATRVANDLLKIKARRFGSIDRESNFLVQAVGGEPGEVRLLPDKEAIRKDLDHKIRRSTQFAVLVMRDEDKAEARKHFSTPLLFSIHEAKGLEYDNIVLFRFVSDHRLEFNDIVDGVTPADLETEELAYRRARDKRDKSLEVYKFFVNALYVALTRAIRNLYLVESDSNHPLFSLLRLDSAQEVKVTAQQSSTEDWQREARRLELQGKQEQAEAIRQTILQEKPVPWPVFEPSRVAELLHKVFTEKAPGNKHRQRLYDMAACHDDPALADRLVYEAGFQPALRFDQQRAVLARKTMVSYTSRNIKDVLRQCEQYGLEHRLPMNLTPLMAAAMVGNVPLVEALLERGADRDNVDHFGCNALHWALREGFRDRTFAQGPLGRLYDLLAPPVIDFNTGERLIRIDKHLSEYLLVQTFWAGFKSRFTHAQRMPYGAFESQDILDAWQWLPASVRNPQRYKRQHISNLLARNEVSRDYAYNRRLFIRVVQGWYQFSPQLSVRRHTVGEERWVPVYEALNLPFVSRFADPYTERMLQHFYKWQSDAHPPGFPEAAAVRAETA